MSKSSIWRLMTRRKPMPEVEESSKLGKVFGTFDLTALGVSATLGVGVYVLAGHVAKEQAGPSVILSFLIAAAASFLAGLCYAEFASRVPKSGSAYIFTYVAIGEFMAFIVGWNLILEYVIGAASISKGLSLYIDSLANDTMKNAFIEIAPINSDFFSNYFDFFSFGGPLLIGLALAFGLSKSAGINNIFCILNLGVVCFVVVAVLYNANLEYWRIDPAVYSNTQYVNATGKGGFFPFGISGMLKGAATCFFGFVGFDCIATTGEEVKNPKKTVPKALLLSLFIIFLAYMGVSSLTLMYPYFMLDSEAPLPHAFQEIGWIKSKWTITLGGVVALIASLFGAMFPLPRILYSMAQDGLIFREFACISQRFKTPVMATLCAAILTAFFAALFDLAALVSMLSIGVLLAYTVVAISIIILRFSRSDDLQITECYIETSNLLRPGSNITPKTFIMQLIRLNSSRHPSSISMFVVGTLLVVFCIATFGLSCTIHYWWDSLADGDIYALTIASVLGFTIVSICIFISIQPRKRFQVDDSETFKVPLVPILPALSIFINIYLMIMLDLYTWIRFGVWMLLGLLVYYPSAWLYNFPSKNTQTTINNDDAEIQSPSSPACNNINNSEHNGSVLSVEIENKEQQTIDDDKTMRSTCGVDENNEERVIIVNENLQSQSEQVNQDDEEYSANVIEILDTILEAATSSDNELKLSEVLDNETSQPTFVAEFSINDINQSEIEAEIDEIIQQATSIVELEIEKRKIETNDNDKNREAESDNVFKNQRFISHLNDLISKSNPARILNRESANMSKTLSRKSISSDAKVTLRHSLSFPDLKTIVDAEITKNSDEVEQVEITFKIPTPPPEPKLDLPSPAQRVNFSISHYKTPSENENEMKSIDNSETSKQIHANENPNEEEDSSTPLNRGNIRDKLEKLLQSAPSRLSLMVPTPLPRTSLHAFENNHDIPAAQSQTQSHPLDTPSPISATMQRQKLLFSEVLKNLKHENNNVDEIKTSA